LNEQAETINNGFPFDPKLRGITDEKKAMKLLLLRSIQE
jgi:hypothetical protein